MLSLLCLLRLGIPPWLQDFEVEPLAMCIVLSVALSVNAALHPTSYQACLLLSPKHVLSTQGPSQVSGLFLSNCLVGIASSQLQGYPVSQL